MGIWDRATCAAAAWGLFHVANRLALVSLVCGAGGGLSRGQAAAKLEKMEEVTVSLAQECANEAVLLLCEAWEGQHRS